MSALGHAFLCQIFWGLFIWLNSFLMPGLFSCFWLVTGSGDALMKSFNKLTPKKTQSWQRGPSFSCTQHDNNNNTAGCNGGAGGTLRVEGEGNDSMGIKSPDRCKVEGERCAPDLTCASALQWLLCIWTAFMLAGCFEYAWEHVRVFVRSNGF